MSVWESIDALWRFVYDGRHLEVMRRRREWFTRLGEAHLALWWIPAGSIPTAEDIRERVEHLRAHGPTPYSFTFKQHFPPPSAPSQERIVDERDPCPA